MVNFEESNQQNNEVVYGEYTEDGGQYPPTRGNRRVRVRTGVNEYGDCGYMTGYEVYKEFQEGEDSSEDFTPIKSRDEYDLPELDDRSSSDGVNLKELKESSFNRFEETYHPIKFKYIEVDSENKDGIIIAKHKSEVTYLLTKPTGNSNQAFISSMGGQKNI